MHARVAIVACLAVSGFSALVYQVLWTRLLGFAFGTTTEAIGSVLAVFFGGLALGNLIAARSLSRLRRPLQAYAAIELGIAGFALASLPLLERLGSLSGGDLAPALRTLLHGMTAALVLLPPTVAMGATLPLVARGFVADDARLGRASAILYTANTLGGVLGAYLCGFWLLPLLGVTRSLLVAVAANVLVAAVARAAAAGLASPVQSRPAAETTTQLGGSRLLLACFGVSGFVAIGYEIIWSKVFGIVMGGSLYGFATVLTGFLFGIGAGSIAIAPRVDRIRDPSRAFALLHLAIAIAVAAGMYTVPFLPYAHEKLARGAGGIDAIHCQFALVLPLVFVPTALFGAAFPVLIRLYARGAADAGRAIGVAGAVNIAGSIAASLCVTFWGIPTLGMDGALLALVVLDLGAALWLLAGAGTRRVAALAGASVAVGAIALAFGGVKIDRAIAGEDITAKSLVDYHAGLSRRAEMQTFFAEGRASIVTVYDSVHQRLLRTDGLPEAHFFYDPPYYALSSVLLGVVPWAFAEAPERALVIGLGGGSTLRTLLETPIADVEVVELESAVVAAQTELYRGRANPLADPRVRLVIDDGRHYLLRGRDEKRYDVIASQPSHPWRAGAANLFTEEFFRLARARLSDTGCFALWINGFSMDAESLLAVVASFERVFPGSQLVELSRHGTREELLLVGGRRPPRTDLATLARRLAVPALADRLATYDMRGPADLLAQFEGPAAAFAALSPDAANTDDNAFVETHVPRRNLKRVIDFAALEARLAPGTPVLPPLRGESDVTRIAESLLSQASYDAPFPLADKLERLLRAHGAGLPAVRSATLVARGRLHVRGREADALAELHALAASAPRDPEPLRALGFHLALARGDYAGAAAAFAGAWSRSHDPEDAYGAGRALHHVDPARAWSWFERIPQAARVSYPRLAYYAADRALRAGAPARELSARRAALLAYRNTVEGREFPLVDPLLARLCHALGEPDLARDFSAAARGAPGGPGARAYARAGEAVDEGDASGLASALEQLRFWAPSLRAAIGAENRFRSDHGLALLPELEARRLVAPDA